MVKLACPPAASSRKVCGGHFRTPIASLITNVSVKATGPSLAASFAYYTCVVLYAATK